MKRGSLETAVGVFVLIGLICVGYLAFKLGRMEWFGNPYYTVEAYFTSVGGLKSGAPVEMAGVDIGQVGDITLDTKSHMAEVRLMIKKNIQLDENVVAAIKTSGLIGDKYISLTPGDSGKVLPPGGTIMDTQSALDIEDLISRFVFGKV